MLTDTRGGQAPNAAERKRVTDGYVTYEASWKQYCAGNAMIVDSQIVRGTITAIIWLRPPPFPVKIFVDAADAEAWARAQLDSYRRK